MEAPTHGSCGSIAPSPPRVELPIVILHHSEPRIDPTHAIEPEKQSEPQKEKKPQKESKPKKRLSLGRVPRVPEEGEGAAPTKKRKRASKGTKAKKGNTTNQGDQLKYPHHIVTEFMRHMIY